MRHEDDHSNHTARPMQGRQQGSDSRFDFDALAAHTGTHVDAPYHFIADGAGIETLDLDVLIGEGVQLDCSHCLSAAAALALACCRL